MLLRTLFLLLVAIAGFAVETPQLGSGAAPIPAGLPPTGAAGGDLAGTYPSPTVTAARFATPGPIGSTVASTGAFSTLTDAGLTVTRVTFAGTAGLLSDDAGMVYTAASDLLVVNHNAAALPAIPATDDTVIQVGGLDANTTRVLIDGFAGAPSFTGRRANTTNASKSGVILNDLLAQINAIGYTSAGAYSTGARGSLQIYANETWDASNQSTKVIINCTPTGGSTTQAAVLTLTTASALFSSTTPVTMSNTTASTTTAGALLIGTGTAATSVTFGGGAGNIGSTLTVGSTTDGTSGSAGAISTLGGIGVTKAGWFGGIVTANGATAAATQPSLVTAGTSTIAGGVTDAYTASHRLTPVYNGAFTVTRHNYLDLNQITGASTITDAAVFRFDAAPGTHKALAADAAVAVTFTALGPTGAQTTIQGWMKINVNGTLRYIPFWEQEVFGSEWRESAGERMNHYPTRFLASQASRPYDRCNVLDME